MLQLARPTFEADLAALIGLADVPNLYLKLSGLHYLAQDAWDFPFLEVQARVLRPLLTAFGAARFVWGSDFSAAGRYITYRQSLELARRRLAGLNTADLDLVLGGTIDQLFRTRRPHHRKAA
jgi:predicted TIM-barrel fold metal-dependent hydrolase